MVVLRTRTPLCVNCTPRTNAMLKINGDHKRLIGPTIVLLPNDEICLPGGTVGDELTIEIDLRSVSSSNHSRAILRLDVKEVSNETDAQQLGLGI